MVAQPASAPQMRTMIFMIKGLPWLLRNQGNPNHANPLLFWPASRSSVPPAIRSAAILWKQELPHIVNPASPWREPSRRSGIAKIIYAIADKRFAALIREAGWSGQLDSNQRPPAPKAGTLANWAMPRDYNYTWKQQIVLSDIHMWQLFNNLTLIFPRAVREYYWGQPMGLTSVLHLVGLQVLYPLQTAFFPSVFLHLQTFETERINMYELYSMVFRVNHSCDSLGNY